MSSPIYSVLVVKALVQLAAEKCSKEVEVDLVFPCIVNFLSLAVLGDFSNASVCCFKSFK